jgi:predicted protein tyrosine phosphatase
MIITFSSIENVPEGADIYLCLADQERHPCFTKRNDREWMNKEFRVLQLNDEGFDERYKSISMEDIEYLANLFKSLDDEHVHVNCHAGISRSAAITILGMMTQVETPTLERFEQCKAMVTAGFHRIPANETYPNEKICQMIKQYFNI